MALTTVAQGYINSVGTGGLVTVPGGGYGTLLNASFVGGAGYPLDDGYYQVNIPFNSPQGINYYGQYQTTMYINVNGYVSFGSFGSTSFVPSLPGVPYIAPLYADLTLLNTAGNPINSTNTNGGVGVYYNYDSVNSVITITWLNVEQNQADGSVSGTASFQIQLIYEGNGDFDIIVRYGTVTGITGGQANFGSSTIPTNITNQISIGSSISVADGSSAIIPVSIFGVNTITSTITATATTSNGTADVGRDFGTLGSSTALTFPITFSPNASTTTLPTSPVANSSYIVEVRSGAGPLATYDITVPTIPTTNVLSTLGFTVTLSNISGVSSGNTTCSVSITNVPPPPVVTWTLPAAATYSATMTNGVGGTINLSTTDSGDYLDTFSIQGSPSWASISTPQHTAGTVVTTATLTISPSVPVGTQTLIIVATDGQGGTSNLTITLTVTSAISWSQPSTVSPYTQSYTPTSTVSVPLVVTDTSASSSHPIVISVQSGSTLPTGISIIQPNSSSPTSGSLSISPSVVPGQYSFVLTASDQYSSANLSFNITIVSVITWTSTSSTLPKVIENVAIKSTQLVATNSAGTTGSGLSYSVTSGALPVGLTLSSTGLLTGTCTSTAGSGTGLPATSGNDAVVGNFTFTVTATDGLGGSASQTFTNYILLPTIVWTTTSFNSFGNTPQVGTAIPATFVSVNDSEKLPVTFSLANKNANGTASALPPGLTFSSGGKLSGTPTASGSYTFTLIATDTAGATASQIFTYTVGISATITWNTKSIPTMIEDIAITPVTLSVTDSLSLPVTFSIKSGSLPTGISLNGSTGIIFGTPTSVGNTSVIITATDSSGVAIDQAFSCTVLAPTVSWANLGLPNSLPQGIAIAPTTISAVDTANLPLTYAVTSGTLPTGLTLSGAGVITGTPTVAGPFNFTVTATDSANVSSAQAFTLTITANGITFTTVPVINAIKTVAITPVQISTVDSAGLPVTFSLASGSTIAQGISLSGTGLISGTPTSTGTYNITVNATDGFTVQPIPVSIVVTVPTITWNTTSLASLLPNTAMTPVVLSATDSAKLPLNYSLTSGTLPTGISLTGTTGTLSGTPTVAGSFKLTFTASDGIVSATQILTLVVSTPIVTWTTTTFPTLVKGIAITPFQLVAKDSANFPLTFTVNSGLPVGLTVSNGGLVTGTPTTVTANVSTLVTASDSYGGTASQTITGSVVSTVVTWTTTILPNMAQNVAITPFQLVATDSANLALTYSVKSGTTLPTGLSLSGTGTLTGTLTSGTGTFPVSIVATDTAGSSATQVFSLIVAPPTVTWPATLTAAAATINASQNVSITPFALNATDSANYPITYTATTGGSGNLLATTQLPPGISINGTNIVGTPTTSATYTFVIKASDGHGGTANQLFTMNVAPPTVTWTTAAALPNKPANTALSLPLVATDSANYPLTYTIASGSKAPTGLTLSSTGTLSGSPTPGTYTFSATASDGKGGSATQAFTITISASVVTWTTTSLTSNSITQKQQLTATDSANYPLTYTVATGSALPKGLTLSSSGMLTGTTVGGAYNFSVTASDAYGGSATQNFTGTFASPTIVPPQHGTSYTFPIGLAISPTINLTSTDSGGYTLKYSLTSGTLPTGLSLNATTGVISGTPTSAVSNTPITVTASDAYGGTLALSFTITITPATITWTTTSLSALVGTATSLPLVAKDSSNFGLTYSLTSGTLPTGLSLNATTGVISGTPTVVGTVQVSITANDGHGGTAVQNVSITISAPTVTWTTKTLPAIFTNSTVNTTLVAVDSAKYALSYVVTSGTLPKNVNLSTAGVLTNTGSVLAGTYNFTVTASDKFGGSAPQAFTWTVTAVGEPVFVTQQLNFTDATTAGLTKTATLTNAGNVKITWSSSWVGTSTVKTPNCTTFGTNTNTSSALSIKAKAFPGQTFTGTLTASFTDPNTGLPNSVSIPMTATYAAPTILVASHGATYTFPVNLAITPINISATDSGGYPVTYAITTGTLPVGLTLNTSTGSITGTPTLVVANDPITITITDQYGGMTTTSLTITITGVAPKFTSTSVALVNSSAITGSGLVANPNNIPITYSLSLWSTVQSGSTVVWNALLNGSQVPDGFNIYVSNNTLIGGGGFNNVGAITITATKGGAAATSYGITATTPGTGGTGWNISGVQYNTTNLALTSNGVLTGSGGVGGSVTIQATFSDGSTASVTPSWSGAFIAGTPNPTPIPTIAPSTSSQAISSNIIATILPSSTNTSANLQMATGSSVSQYNGLTFYATLTGTFIDPTTGQQGTISIPVSAQEAPPPVFTGSFVVGAKTTSVTDPTGVNLSTLKTLTQNGWTNNAAVNVTITIANYGCIGVGNTVNNYLIAAGYSQSPAFTIETLPKGSKLNLIINSNVTSGWWLASTPASSVLPALLIESQDPTTKITIQNNLPTAQVGSQYANYSNLVVSSSSNPTDGSGTPYYGIRGIYIGNVHTGTVASNDFSPPAPPNTYAGYLAIVGAMYTSVLKRAADPTGLVGWTNYIMPTSLGGSGGSIAQLYTFLSTSPEGKGISPTTPANTAYTAVVNALYALYLPLTNITTTSGQSGVTYWVNYINQNNTSNPTTVASSLVQSFINSVPQNAQTSWGFVNWGVAVKGIEYVTGGITGNGWVIGDITNTAGTVSTTAVTMAEPPAPYPAFISAQILNSSGSVVASAPHGQSGYVIAVTWENDSASINADEGGASNYDIQANTVTATSTAAFNQTTGATTGLLTSTTPLSTTFTNGTWVIKYGINAPAAGTFAIQQTVTGSITSGVSAGKSATSTAVFEIVIS